jgi:F-type H+-transporting ATPase subunit epsilon
MAKNKLHCSLITPEAMVFEDDVDFVSIPAHDGEIGLLFNRAPLVCQLGSGRLKIRNGVEEQIWFIDGGFAQVVDNRVTVLTQKALRPADINRAEASQALEQARHMPATDDAAARRRARAETSARARLRMAK